MILTTKTSYAVRALIGVAFRHSAGVPVTVKTVAAEEGISDVYLEQILNRLKRKGILKSIRGAKGGYLLSRSPKDITVYDIVIALEESIAPSKCSSLDGEVCSRADKCVSKDMWDEIESSMKGFLEEYTLQELLERTLEKNPRKEG